MSEGCADCRRRTARREARRRNPAEAQSVGSAIRRLLSSLTKRHGDEWAFGELYALAVEVDAAVAVAAREVAEQQSWTYVGKLAGMTRQGARQRWAPRTPSGAVEDDGQLPGQARIG
jgi:hypothetical protein